MKMRPRQGLALVLSSLAVAGCAHVRPEGTRAEARVDRSQAPVPPPSADGEALRAVAPRRAVDLGISGRAVVRIRLDAEGHATSVTVIEESPGGFGFGEACATLFRAHATGWRPARDASGQARAYIFSMPCTFDVFPLDAEEEPTESAVTPCEPPEAGASSQGEASRGGSCTPPVSAPSLSRRPAAPPGLNDALLRALYPVTARRLGVEGTALMRVTIDRAGNATGVRIISENPPGQGFGVACESALRSYATGWQPALDAAENPVDHAFPFRCTFEIAD
jgi:hypothetical protein